VAGARVAWGWHRLDPRWAERLVDAARIRPGALVLDIGAGDGIITAALVDAGARVIAVELHPERLAALRRRFGARVVVVRADATALKLPRRPYHVVANPPFAATSPLLRRLLQPGTRLVSAHLVLQDHAARRWAGPDAPAAARWRRDFDAALGAHVPRHAFRPAPKVDSRVLAIELRRPPQR